MMSNTYEKCPVLERRGDFISRITKDANDLLACYYDTAAQQLFNIDNFLMRRDGVLEQV